MALCTTTACGYLDMKSGEEGEEKEVEEERGISRRRTSRQEASYGQQYPCPALTPLLQLLTPSRASGTADHVRSLDD